MPTYITLFHYTQKGIETVKDSPSRLDAAKEAARSLGAEIKAFYLTMGRYDGVVIIEAPDDETMAQMMLATGAQGSIRTETLKAFTEEEFRRIVAGLP